MLPARVAKHTIKIKAGVRTPAFFVPDNGRSAAACPSFLHLSSPKAASS